MRKCKIEDSTEYFERQLRNKQRCDTLRQILSAGEQRDLLEIAECIVALPPAEAETLLRDVEVSLNLELRVRLWTALYEAARNEMLASVDPQSQPNNGSNGRGAP